MNHSIDIPPEQEELFHKLFANTKQRGYIFEQEQAQVEAQAVIKIDRPFEHELIMDVLKQVEDHLGNFELSKKIRKRVFMVSCELLLSRDMGFEEPVGFVLSEDEAQFSMLVRIPIPISNGNSSWISQLEEIDELLGSINGMSDQELKEHKLALFASRGMPAQRYYNWLDIARKSDGTIMYDFQLVNDTRCQVCLLARINK